MKKFLIFLLAAAVLLSFTSCVAIGGEAIDTATDVAIQDGNDAQGGEDNVAVFNEWYTKPFHIKGTVYNDNEPDGEMEIIYDGESLFIWNGEDGKYAYMDGDTLMENHYERDDDVVGLTYHGDARSSTILEFMENQADFLGGIIYYIETLSEYKLVGEETVEGFDCVKYVSDEDMLGNTYAFWIDKATGVFVKEHTEMTLDMIYGTKLETPEIEIKYVVNYISVNNVPSVSSVYELPTE